jgi:hypothetical protein
MPTPAIERSDNAMRIQSLEVQIREGFTRMETLLSSLDSRLRAVEQCQAEQKAAQTIRIDIHETTLTRLTNRIVELETWMDKAVPWVAGVKWLAGAFGLLLISLLWGILTGSVTLVVP